MRGHVETLVLVNYVSIDKLSCCYASAFADLAARAKDNESTNLEVEDRKSIRSILQGKWCRFGNSRMKLRKEIRYQKARVIITQAVDVYSQLFDLILGGHRTRCFQSCDLSNECIQLVPKSSVRPCFPVSIDVHTL